MYNRAIANYATLVIRVRGRTLKTLNFQLSTVNRSRAPDARTTTFNCQSIASGDARTNTLNDRSRAGTLALPLSTLNSQLSTLNSHV
ncbi:MAG: hypothetical protein ACRC62_37225 [Microcoleus sp.]